ncbi:hypothetical protein CIL03_07975 [Virgibacillus indicus]|uniref:ABC transporter domain-containing protein n=1 Tax=Virgibacillus indicus TaxID=2024554 RepID=A0A265NBV9_9BACI|nr:ABC transporter ATP-binding protein [Virgibacillus indicus]OZU88949.1 hypothetical protein CIL03_07975 [Virgibacillus indicus]
MKAFVEVDHLSLQFDNQPEKNILSDVSFQLDQGESLLLLGPSGSGKSTLTFCLNGIYPKELDGNLQGDVWINGKQTADYLPGQLSQQVGVVFQDPETQFCMLTVEDEVAFGLENISFPPSLMESRINQVLEMVHMLPLKKEKIHSLSGGQKQKLALACVLALEPALLILDEPTANLDPVATKDLIQTIHNVKQKNNCSVIIIEHQLDGWTAIAERCLLLNRNGQIFYDGTLRNAIKDQIHQLDSEGIWLPKITQYLLQHAPKVIQNPPLTIEEFSNQEFLWSQTEWKDMKQVRSLRSNVLLDASDISLSKNNKKIIKAISLTAYEGEFIAIVGANGSGKTSLSRLMTGIQKPSSGTILVKGKPIKNWRESDLRKEIGYVFQNPEHQFITNSVFDEVAFGLRIQNKTEEEIKKNVHSILNICGIPEYANEHPYTLSQGQKRRLSVATMIINNQQLLILDEPTFGQDAHSNLELMKLLQERYAKGTTIIMITHDMELVNNYATRVIAVDKGEIAADCTPEELWNKAPEELNQWQLEIPIPVQLKKRWEKGQNYVSTSS